MYRTVQNFRQYLAIPTIVSLLLYAVAPAVVAAPEDIDRLTEQWLQIEQQKQNLQNDWAEQKPAMQQRQSLLKAEKKQLTEMLQESAAGQDDVEARRSELLARQAELESQQEKLTTELDRLQASVESLVPMLPPTVQQTWDREQSAVGEQSETSVLLQGTLAKLSELTEFDRRLATNEAVITAPDGQDVLVKQLYLGAGFAWFTSREGDYAGYGAVVDHQWQWQFDEDLDSDAINRAIAVFERREQPQLIQLPVLLSNTSSSTSSENASPSNSAQALKTSGATQ